MNDLGRNEPTDVLGRSSVFGVLTAEARARLTASGTPMALEPGALLCQQGDPADAAWVVTKGEVEVRAVARDGQQVRIAVLTAGAVVGELSALDGEPRSADVVAVGRVQLLKLTRASLISALEEEPAAALALIRTLSLRLRAADQALETLQTKDLGGRLAGLLLLESGDRALVAVSQGELARRVGASREKVNRKLAQWRASGWLEVTRAGLRLLDKDALSRAAR